MREVVGEVSKHPHFLEVKRARSLQDHLRNLTFAFTDMGPQPGRDIRRLHRGRRTALILMDLSLPADHFVWPATATICHRSL
jgi:hypothetical protein